MSSLFRQLRGEIRKGLTPITVATMLGASLLASLMQYNTAGNHPAPSLTDTTGTVTIALLQHATLFGFVIAGIIAGQMTGTEMGDSSIMVTLTAEPRRSRLLLLKTTATAFLVLLSTAVMIGVLTLTSLIMESSGFTFQDQQGTPFNAVVDTGSRFLLVVLFVSAVATALATWTGSTIAPAMIGAGAFISGLMLSGVDNVAADPSIRFAEFTPYMWVTRWMQPGSFSRFADFVGNATTPMHIQRSALILLVAISLSLIGGSRQLHAAIRNPKGNQ